MTRREKVLATTLVILLLVVGGGGAFYAFVYEPLNEVKSQLAAAEEQYNKKAADRAAEEQQIKGVLRVDPRLSQWAKISLPPRNPEVEKLPVHREEKDRRHKSDVLSQYESYLSKLLTSSGLTEVQINTATPDRRTTLTTPKGKEPTYERFAFKATGKGNKESVVKMLRKFHTDPILQQVRKLSVSLPEKGQSSAAAPAAPAGGMGGMGGGMGGFARRGGGNQEGTLAVDMTVEALMVAGAEERRALMPDQIAYPPTVLPAGREYDRLAKRNMFIGVTAPIERAPERTTEDRADVLRFIKLTTLYYNPERRRWEASIYDQAAGPRRVEEEDDDGNKTVSVIWERQLNTRTLTELKVQDRFRNTILDAKVVHIDERQLIFQAGTQFFRLRCGDALHPAIEKPLDEDEVKELGLAE